ncbi:hypothetical protein [Halonatronum saccharophilum]|uniref:hypothetical protein n=1 Tax=Halonatronum saccharophilum TaxID=150060 RepID=UPI000481E049|nr:hypothetical protein [Halonatronum saccharophilum]
MPYLAGLTLALFYTSELRNEKIIPWVSFLYIMVVLQTDLINGYVDIFIVINTTLVASLFINYLSVAIQVIIESINM